MAEATVETLVIDIQADASKATSEINDLKNQIKGLSNSFKNASVSGFSKSVNRTTSGIKSMTASAKKASSGLANFANSLKRIAFYRFLRTIIKEIGEAFREGLNNAVAFSRTVNGEMAKALDSIASKSGVMKNQLGASLGELLQTLQPILEAIISIINRIAQAMSQLFALLGGRSTWQKATGSVNQWGKAAGGAGKAAKEWKNQLLGFDEINRLNDQNSGRGGGGGGNSGFGGWNIAEELSEWAKELQALLKTAFMTGDFFDVGAWIGEKISLAFDKYTEWLEGIDWHKIGTSITSFIIGLFDGIDWGSISRAFTTAVRSGLDLIGGLIDGVDWYKLPGRIAEQIREFVEGADWAALFHKSGEIIGKALVAAINFAKGLWDTILKPKFMEFLPDNFDDFGEEAKFFEWGKAIVKGIILGFGEALVEFPTTVKEMVMQGIASAFGKEEEWTEMGKTPGGQVIKGLILGLSSTAGVTDPVSTLIYNIKKLFTDGFEIGSPSKWTEGVGENVVQGFINGIDNSWSGIQTKLQTLFDSLKTWWTGLDLGSFKIKMPHIETTWESVGGIIADWFGITAIPHFSVSWYAKGGIVDGATLLGAGEAGKEAIVPLEQNTQWTGMVSGQIVADLRNSDIGMDSDRVIDAILAMADRIVESVNNKDLNIDLDGRTLTKTVTRLQKQFARAEGA